MCRWIAYIGKPIWMDTLVTRPANSLMRQSFDAKMHFNPDGSSNTTNADGFGLGWYAGNAEPGIYKVADPAWSNENIKEICANVQSPLFMAHIRAASTGAIQRSNAHPFKYKNWLFQHNGRIEGFSMLKRALQFDISPELYPLIRGTTDSETIFWLLLTFGLEKDPINAVRRMIARVEQAYQEHALPVQMTLSCAMSDGNNLYTIRYANGVASNSQYYFTEAYCMSSEEENIRIPTGGVVIVSEPLTQEDSSWNEMPDGSFATIRNGKTEIERL